MEIRLSEADLEAPVTRYMRTEFASVDQRATVGEGLAALRAQPPQSRIIYFYVVDDARRLVGVVPTRRLLLTSFDTPIHEIMVREVVTIRDTATVLEACEFFTLHRLLAFPVVDSERRIVGTIDVELYTEGIEEIEQAERSDELFQLIGVHVTEAQQASPWPAFRSRFPWLLCNVAGGILAAFLAGVYEAELDQVVALALFLPVVLALGESVTIQSVSLSLQMLRAHPPSYRVLFLRLRRELLTGALLGLGTALIVAAVALVWLGKWKVGLCLLGGITGGVISAALIGVAMPNLLRLMHRDPHVAAGPIALTLTDVATLLAYFNLARLLFS